MKSSDLSTQFRHSTNFVIIGIKVMRVPTQSRNIVLQVYISVF